MTKKETIRQLKYMLERMPDEPPLECDYIEEWLDTDRKIRSAFKTAIKIIEQEPCEDCVSRKAVLDMCKKEIDHISKNWQNYHSPSEAKSGFEYIAKNIYDLPPVTPTHTETVTDFADRCRECGKHANKWIPVSERLPEEETDVLICNSKGNIEVSRGSVFDDGTWEWYTSGWHFGEVLAWMPLPKPYKAEMERKE